MKAKTFNKIVRWHTATKNALGDKKFLLDNDGVDYLAKRIELQTIGTLLELLRDEVDE